MDGSLRRSQGWPLGWVGASLAAIFAVGVILSLSGCVNLFSGVDHPSGDAQILSKARADLDAGDYQDALTEYQKLSSAYSDIQNSEEAYTTLAEQGAGMAAFAGAFGNGKNVNVGTAMTNMANSILAIGAGTAQRLTIYNAFIKFQSITDNSGLSYLVQFLGSTAFASEILAEIAAAQGASTLTTAEVSSNTAIPCTVNNTANEPLESVSAATITSGAGLDLFNAALQDIKTSINGLSGSGALYNTFNNIFTQFTTVGYGCGNLGTGTSTYNAGLITLGVGGT